MSQNDELVKSIDALLDEVFSAESVEKSIDIAKDSSTKADDAVNKAPKAQKDEDRGAGRPKQISDIPQSDMDGRRESAYDDSITENEGKELEPEEAEQSEAMDQSSDKNRMKGSPKAPQSAPFKKSEVAVSEAEYKEFLSFKKAKEEELKKAEELKKSEELRKANENLIKAAVDEATDRLRKENEELKKSFAETQALIKAMASRPTKAKSITSIEALEKSVAPEDRAQTFSKSEILDAAFELAKSGKISDNVVSEIEMTGRCHDAESRAKIEKYLTGGK